MTTLEEELAYAGVPYSPQEFGWAVTRPQAYRVPLPVVGQRVLWRGYRWGYGQETPAVVVAVPDLERPWSWKDFAESGETDLDTCVWQMRRSNRTGEVELDPFGGPKVELVPDPWPVVRLRIEGRVAQDMTREARLRGSPGWLPLDWQERYRPGPHMGGQVVGRGVALPQGLRHVRTDKTGRIG